MLTSDARVVWNASKGILCVYKPADVSCRNVIKAIKYKITSELNELNCRPPIDYVSIEGNTSKYLSVVRKPSFADDPLVVGPRYQYEDLRCAWSSYLGRNTSGVLLLGIQNGTKTASIIRINKLSRVYRVKGVLGFATDNFYMDGKVVEKSTFKFIKHSNMIRYLATMQAAHQKKMFELCGVDIQSQAAYDLAIQGPIRPLDSKIPLLYGIKCVHFDLPNFTIEVHCVNEYEMYLKTLIHEIGVKLNSTAHCTQIQCIRHSYFNLDNALLRKHWSLQHIISNIEECQSIIAKNECIIRQENVRLQSTC